MKTPKTIRSTPFSDVETATKEAIKRAEELQELVDRAAVYYQDTIKQAGQLVIQDYENLNHLGLLLGKYQTVSNDTVRYPKEGK